MKRRESLPAVEEAQAKVVKELQDAGKLPPPDALTDESQLPESADSLDDVPKWNNPGIDHSMMYRRGDIVRYNNMLVKSVHEGLNGMEPTSLNLEKRYWEEVPFPKKADPEEDAEGWEDEPWSPETAEGSQGSDKVE